MPPGPGGPRSAPVRDDGILALPLASLGPTDSHPLLSSCSGFLSPCGQDVPHGYPWPCGASKGDLPPKRRPPL